MNNMNNMNNMGKVSVDIWLSQYWSQDATDNYKQRVLSRYCGLAPDQVQIRRSPEGKPGLADSAVPCEFSMSHCDDWIVCAVAGATPVGVDMEVTNKDRDFLRLAKRFFDPQEATALAGLVSTARADYFFDLWTLKEAAIKAHGGTLGPGLTNWGFSVTREHPTGTIDAFVKTQCEESLSAAYCLIEPLQNLRLALCWLETEPSRPEVTLFTEREKEVWVESKPAASAISGMLA